MHSVETRKFFIPCVVLIEENGRLYGSEKKAFQGVDLLYERKRSLKLDAESNSVRPDTLVSLSLQGFAHPRIVYPSDIKKTISRFIFEGKVTLVFHNNHKVFFSNALEASLSLMVQHIAAVNPKCDVSLPYQSTPSSSCSTTIRGPSASTTVTRVQPTSTSSHTLLTQKSNLTSRGSQPLIFLPVTSPKKIKLVESAGNTTFDHLTDDLLCYILRGFGVHQEALPVCRRFCDVLRHSRRALSARAWPREVASTPNLPPPTSRATPYCFPSELLSDAVVGSPHLQVLDLTYASGIKSAHLDVMFLSSGKQPFQLEALALRTSGRVSDTVLRSIFHRQRRLKRINLIDVSCSYNDALVPFFYHERRISSWRAPLEALWLGRTAPSSSCTLTSTSFRDETLDNLLGYDFNAHTQNSNGSSSDCGATESCPKGPSGSNSVFDIPLLSLTLAHCIHVRRPLALKRVGATLIELDIRGTSISDTVGQEVFRFLPQLKYLNVSETQIGDASIAVLLESCPHLEVIDFSNVFGLGRTSPELLVDAVHRWTNLHSLKLADNTFFATNVVRHLLFRLPSLAVLDVSGCLHLRENDIFWLPRSWPIFREGFSSLKLYITKSSLTDRIMQGRLHGCHVTVFNVGTADLFPRPHVPLEPFS